MPLLPLTARHDDLEHPLEGRERLDVSRVFGYGGATVAIFAIYSLLVVTAGHGGWATLGVALGYALPLVVGAWYCARNGLGRTAGLLATVAATLAPWVVYAVERLADWRPGSADFLSADLPPSETRWKLFAILVAAAVAALFAFTLLRFSFLFAVAVPSLIAAALDLSPIVIGDHPSEEASLWTSVVIGGATVAIGLFLDAVGRRRDGFWWHVFGLSTVLFGLAVLASSHEWLRWVGLGFAVAVALAATLLRRETWAAIAGVGIFLDVGYHVGHAAERRHWLLPLLFSLVALAAVAIAVRPRRRAVVVEEPVVEPVSPAPSVDEPAPTPEETSPVVEDLPPPVDEPRDEPPRD